MRPDLSNFDELSSPLPNFFRQISREKQSLLKKTIRDLYRGSIVLGKKFT